LGQFSPLAENNKYWGEGFTEWHNVAKARPLFPGHIQPVIPGRLGFYDLRCDETIMEQFEYAKEIGVDAFCYWHYWFAGKRVLHRTFDRMIDLPCRGVKVMLGWANESWSGVWHGLPSQIMIQQTYNREELRAHAKLIACYINSEKYIKTDNLSPFLIYKPRMIPDAKNYLDELRENVKKQGGGDLYIIGNSGPGRKEEIKNPDDFGLDAIVANNVGNYFNSDLAQSIYYGAWGLIKAAGFGPEIRSYRSVTKSLLAAHRSTNGVVHSTVVTGWDNTPRSGRRGLILRGFNENSFRDAASAALRLEERNTRQLLFVKSWNEWAEGNMIEPKFNESWSAGQVLSALLSYRS